MKKISAVRPHTYFDSVTLMGASKRLAEDPEIARVSISMGTELNQALLREAGLNTPETDAAGPNDLMIVLLCDDSASDADMLAKVKAALAPKRSLEAASNEEPPATIRTAVARMPETDLALVSVPGLYAGLEAKRAIEAGLSVLIFSDNVPVQTEIEIKEYAHQKGLLAMGPDCGTAVINGIGIGFSNVVSRGPVGIIGASGTGMQEVMALLDEAGIGISEALGVGGRDLSEAVGGRMAVDAMQLLAGDPETHVIVLIAKSASPEAAAKLRAQAEASGKPVVICFIGTPEPDRTEGSIAYRSTLAGAAAAAAGAAGAPKAVSADSALPEALLQKVRQFSSRQRYVRGVFCGGTLANEARTVFRSMLPDAEVFSNIAHSPEEKLDGSESRSNTFLDMGDDAFTIGRAHPMIDPSIRNGRLLTEALDEETAVVLFDVVLGYGAAADPLDGLKEALCEAQSRLASLSRSPIFIARVLGTAQDPQNANAVKAALEELGVVIAPSNEAAARLAARIVKEIEK